MRGAAWRRGCAAIAAVGCCLFAAQPSDAQGQRLDACARGNVQVCFTLLQRPRLDPGRRAAIEFHLAELETVLASCSSGDATACNMLAQRYPDLPPDLRQRSTR